MLKKILVFSLQLMVCLNLKAMLYPFQEENKFNLNDIGIKEFKKKQLLGDFENFIYDCMCPQNLKNIVDMYKNLKEEAFNDFYAKSLPRFFLIYGPSGVGKSTIAVTVAKKMGIEFEFVNFSGLMTFGEEFCPFLCYKDPCALIIDNIDDCLSKENMKDSFLRSKLRSYLNVFDIASKNSNFIVILVANDIDAITEKIIDRIGVIGRFKVDLPNQQVREKVLRYLTNDSFKNLSNGFSVSFDKSINFSKVSKQTEGLSIRGLQDVVRAAFLASIGSNKKIIVDDFAFEKACQQLYTVK